MPVRIELSVRDPCLCLCAVSTSFARWRQCVVTIPLLRLSIGRHVCEPITFARTQSNTYKFTMQTQNVTFYTNTLLTGELSDLLAAEFPLYIAFQCCILAKSNCNVPSASCVCSVNLDIGAENDPSKLSFFGCKSTI